MTITLQGEPKSTQHIYKYACRPFPKMYMTKEGSDLKTAYQWEAKSQWKRKPHTGRLGIEVTFYFGTKRKADLDNFNKLWQDALTGVVYEDDSQIDRLTLTRNFDKKNPRIEITV